MTLAKECDTQQISNSISFPSWPQYAPDEIAAATKILGSGKVNYWTGNEGKAFEKEFAEYLGVNHAIAVMNGTVAIELALRALDIGPGDEVIVPCRTFIATASAVIAVGAIPVMADIDINSQNITVKTAIAALSPRTKAIIVVHLGGWPCDMPAINAFAKQHNLKIIEDCAQATGAKLNDKLMGSWGDIAAFSFCQDKIITTGGEGGMVTTHDESLWQKMWAYKDHGKNYNTVYLKQHPPGFRWLHETFGSNFRMSEIQAGIGRIQLTKLNDWIMKRKNNAAILNEKFSNISAFRVTLPENNIKHSYYMYYVFIKPELLKSDWNRNRIMLAINAENIPCLTGKCSEIYLEKAFESLDLQPATRLPVAKELSETSLMFYVHPTLTIDDMKYIANKVENIMQLATKA